MVKSACVLQQTCLPRNEKSLMMGLKRAKVIVDGIEKV
jgi:hypothetical protein